MKPELTRHNVGWHALLWLARITAVAAIVPLMQVVFTESGAGPQSLRAGIYLALFPFGFTAGYLLGGRWPILGGVLSLACMAASLLVVGRTFRPEPYLFWSFLCTPGVLYLLAGWKLNSSSEKLARQSLTPIVPSVQL
jgi:hypothetical protein